MGTSAKDGVKGRLKAYVLLGEFEPRIGLIQQIRDLCSAGSEGIIGDVESVLRTESEGW